MRPHTKHLIRSLLQEKNFCGTLERPDNAPHRVATRAAWFRRRGGFVKEGAQELADWPLTLQRIVQRVRGLSEDLLAPSPLDEARGFEEDDRVVYALDESGKSWRGPDDKGAKEYFSPNKAARQGVSINLAQRVIVDIARGLKEKPLPDPDAVRQAVNAMDGYVPPGSILIPIPSSSGDTTANFILAKALATTTGSAVWDVLSRHAPVQSSSVLRAMMRSGLTPEQHGFVSTVPIDFEVPYQSQLKLQGQSPVTLGDLGVRTYYSADLDPDEVQFNMRAREVIFLDNVIQSGATIAAARRVTGLEKGWGLAYATSGVKPPNVKVPFGNEFDLAEVWPLEDEEGPP